MVDGSQHIARLQPDIFGEGVGFHRIDPDPAFFLEAQGLAPLVGEVLKPHAQAHRGAFRLIRSLLVARAELLREELGQVADHHVEVLALVIAHHPDVQRSAHGRRGHRVDQIVASANRLAVDGHDDVAFLDPGLFRAAAHCHRLDERAFADARLFQQGAGLVGVGNHNLDADSAARHLAVLDDLVINQRRHVHGHGEAHALVAARCGGCGDGRVDANHFAADVEQRSAAVAGVNGRIGLQEVLELRFRIDIALLGADDARGHGGLEAEWRANGDGPVAHLHGVGIADLGGHQVLLAFHADDREVGGRIHTHHLGVVLGGIAGELHLDAVGLVDHVIVGQDVAGRVHYYAGTQRIALPLGHVGGPVTERTPEETLEKVVHTAVVALVLVVRGHHLALAATGRRPHGRLRQIGGGNVDHGRFHPLGNLAERVGQFLGVRNDQRRRSGRYLAILGCLYTRVNQGADHDTDRQREQHQRERKKLLRAQFVKDTHGPSCLLRIVVTLMDAAADSRVSAPPAQPHPE